MFFNIIDYFNSRHDPPREPMEYVLNNQDKVARLRYRVKYTGSYGVTTLREVYGTPCSSERLKIPCSAEGFGVPLEAPVNLAELGFVRAYRKRQNIVIERNVSCTPPEEVESFLVNVEMSLVMPEYYGKDNSRTYIIINTPIGDIEDHLQQVRWGTRYYVGDLVKCGGVDTRARILEEVRRELRAYS